MTDRPIRFHVSLPATRAHFEASVSFYAQLFGVEPAKRKPGYAKFDVAEPSINLTLNEVEEVRRGDLDHLGIQVWSDDTLTAARQRLTTSGMSVLDEENVECCYAGQNKFWVVDPDGRHVEFFHVLRDVEHHGHQGPVASAKNNACCAPSEDAAASGCCAPEKDASPLKVTSLKARASECCG